MTERIFQHVVSDSSDFCVWAELPACISMSWSEAEGFWLSANREGYEHLARVFAEMALDESINGTHFHVDQNFGGSGNRPEFSFELDPDLATRIPMEEQNE